MPDDTTTTTQAAAAVVDYAFSNRVAEAPQQLSALEQYLDPLSIRVLDEVDLRPGAHVLELGPGRGSIAHHLADRVGPGGTVVAVDRDPGQLHPGPTMQVHQHNLQQGLPPAAAGGFDLIHARLVLVHLPNRRQLLRQLIDRLNPAGWIVLGEFSGRPLTPLAGSGADADLFTKVIDVFRSVLVQRYGADMTWADQLHTTLAGAGLEQVKTVEHAQSWTGGDPGCQLHVANISQMRDRLVDVDGVTDADIAHFLGLMADPAFSSRSWQFICTRARKHPPEG